MGLMKVQNVRLRRAKISIISSLDPQNPQNFHNAPQMPPKRFFYFLPPKKCSRLAAILKNLEYNLLRDKVYRGVVYRDMAENKKMNYHSYT